MRAPTHLLVRPSLVAVHGHGVLPGDQQHHKLAARDVVLYRVKVRVAAGMRCKRPMRYARGGSVAGQVPVRWRWLQLCWWSAYSTAPKAPRSVMTTVS